MDLPPERKRLYLAVLVGILAIILMWLLFGVNGDFFVALIWLVVVMGASGLGIWFLVRTFLSVSPIPGKAGAIYSRRCDVEIGYRYFSWLVTRVSVYEGVLVIQSLQRINLLPQDIWNIKPARRPVKPAILIQHTRSDVPRPVILFSWDSTLLQESIETGLHLREMPHYGREPVLEGVSDEERKERRKYPWLM